MASDEFFMRWPLGLMGSDYSDGPPGFVDSYSDDKRQGARRAPCFCGSKIQPKKIWFKALEFSASARMNGIHAATTWVAFGLTLVT